MNRRHFLGVLGSPALLASPAARAWPRLRELREDSRSAAEIARDEDYWKEVQEAFPVDRAMTNLNNGGVCPSPSIVQEALRRRTEFANGAPAYRMWRLQEPEKEAVRTHLARHLGARSEEVAITRNASEGLQICQFGFDLAPGDEVLCSDQDYPRMIAAFRQRERREGLRLVRFPLPVPLTDPAEVVRRYAERITDRTRLILVCHVINLTGQVLPVRAVCALGRERGIPVVVDGAHSFAHFPFDWNDLGCEYFATSLHKWLFAPIGTGLLAVRRERIGSLWPLMAADPGLDGDVRKFEQVGTHPVPILLSIAEALLFHEMLGPERKAARLVLLRDRWASRFAGRERVRFHTHLAPGAAWGIATVGIEGIDTSALQEHLWMRHGIFTVAIRHHGVDGQGVERTSDGPPQFEGLRISPAPYTTLNEVDRFADALEEVAQSGLPA